ncbi:hypothetical protein N8301_01790 [Cyclobacteriaceae bacterium]|nr:hypothetical protein [Cyclobacteriaceae bacterium]
MKKYFVFDDEPITGMDYWIRVIWGNVSSFFLIGLLILAATGYKRSGALGWKKELRVLTAIFIPIIILSMFLVSVKYGELASIITASGLVIHLILIFKDGNLRSIK